MIKVTIGKNLIIVEGHAGYNDPGKDVLCACVSTAVTMSINQIEVFELLDHIQYELKPGYLKLQVVTNDENLEKILKNLIFMLSDLESQYPDFIKIKENM